MNENIYIEIDKDKEPYIKEITNDKVINVTGQSGSGKSTYIKELLITIIIYLLILMIFLVKNDL